MVASVCKNWSDIVKQRFKNVRKIGKHCTNVDKCKDNKCFMPSQILAALTHLKVDVSVDIFGSSLSIILTKGRCQKHPEGGVGDKVPMGRFTNVN